MIHLHSEYNESLSFDKAFYRQDILGSIAYARANVKTGILTRSKCWHHYLKKETKVAGEFEKIEEGLKQILQEWEDGKFEAKDGDEEYVYCK